jgi:cysteine synthase A
MKIVVVALAAASLACGLVVGVWLGKRRKKKGLPVGLLELIGNTPTIVLPALSAALGCQVCVKLEFLNPGGTAKDRAARQIVLDAEKEGKLVPGVSTIYEGSAGSTGISLTLIAWARRMHAHICIPEDMAVEKADLLKCLGAEVERIPPTSFSDPEHFCNIAETKAARDQTGFFANQVMSPIIL